MVKADMRSACEGGVRVMRVMLEGFACEPAGGEEMPHL